MICGHSSVSPLPPCLEGDVEVLALPTGEVNPLQRNLSSRNKGGPSLGSGSHTGCRMNSIHGTPEEHMLAALAALTLPPGQRGDSQHFCLAALRASSCFHPRPRQGTSAWVWMGPGPFGRLSMLTHSVPQPGRSRRTVYFRMLSQNLLIIVFIPHMSA